MFNIPFWMILRWNWTFCQQILAAILDFPQKIKGQMITNYLKYRFLDPYTRYTAIRYNNKYAFLDPQNSKNYILHSTVHQQLKIFSTSWVTAAISNFHVFTQSAHHFLKGHGAKSYLTIIFNHHRWQIHSETNFYLTLFNIVIISLATY